jgi:ankyrin repeat protein
MAGSVRTATAVILTSAVAIAIVTLAAVSSIFLVFAVKSLFQFITHVVSVFGEIVVALIAAATSGATVTLTVLVAAGSASMTFPASSIEARIGVSVVVSGAAIVSCAAVLIILASLNVNWEVISAVVSAAAMAVAFAAAWAVGVMSLIEKETQQVGLKMTSILDAVRSNNHRILRLLLKLHAGLKQRDLDLALLHAVKAGFPECTEALLSAGANPNTRDSHENAPLALACETGCFKIAEVLLRAGAIVDGRNGSRGTALHYAAKWGYEDCVELLLSHGADSCAQDGLWRTPLILASRYAHKANSVINMLIKAGCDVNIIGTEQRTALHYAAARDLDLNILLEAGGNPHKQDTEGNIPLHHAAMEGSANAVKILLKAGSNPKVQNYQRRTAVHYAAMRGQVDCLEDLVKAGGDPHSTDASGVLPVWYATNNGHLPAVIFFIRQNTPLSQFTSPEGHILFGANPLHTALEKSYLDIAKVLVIGGCNQKPLYHWLENRSPECSWDECAEHIAWLQQTVSTPCTLAHACRLVVRRVLGRDILKKEEFLPLPQLLKQYITLTELENEQVVTSGGYSNFALMQASLLC